MVLAVTLYAAGAVTLPPLAFASPPSCAEQGEAGRAKCAVPDDADADTDGPQNSEDGGQVGGDNSADDDSDQTEGSQAK